MDEQRLAAIKHLEQLLDARAPALTPAQMLAKGWRPGRTFLAARVQKNGNVKVLWRTRNEPLPEVLKGMVELGFDDDSLRALGVPQAAIDKARGALSKAHGNLEEDDSAAAASTTGTPPRRHGIRHQETGQFVPAGHPRARPQAGLFRSANAYAHGLFGPSRAAAETARRKKPKLGDPEDGAPATGDAAATGGSGAQL